MLSRKFFCTLPDVSNYNLKLLFCEKYLVAYLKPIYYLAFFNVILGYRVMMNNGSS